MIYLDSCVLIYAVEDSGPRGELVRKRLALSEEIFAVSSLVLHECLVGPLKDGSIELRNRYLHAYQRLREIPLDTGVYVQAAELRAAFGLKTPDALHLAAAQRTECSELWTNDKRLVTASRGLALDIMSA